MSGWHANTKSVKSYGKRGTRVVKVLVDLTDSPVKERVPSTPHFAHVSSSPGKVLFVRSATSTTAKRDSSTLARKDVLQDKNGSNTPAAAKDGPAKKSSQADVCKAGGKQQAMMSLLTDDELDNDHDQENVGVPLAKLKPSASKTSSFKSSSSSEEVVALPRKRTGKKLAVSVIPSTPPSTTASPVARARRSTSSRLSAAPSTSSISSSSRSRSQTPASDASPPRPTRASRSKRAVVPDTPPTSHPSPVASSSGDHRNPTTISLPASPISSRSASPALGSTEPLTPLADLLAACNQSPTSAPTSFIDFLSSPHLFPPSSERTITKVGEATYSEVFAISCEGKGQEQQREDLVMKVIPLMDDQRALEVALEGLSLGKKKEEEATTTEEEDEEDEEAEPVWSDPRDVAKEVRLGRLVGELEGFCDLIGAFVVQGSYPAQLLDQWDAFAEASPEKTENAHPSVFPPTQLYAVLLLPYGGKDLESYTFSKSRPWAEAAGIFWSVAQSLAIAEEQLRFEHRDLHLGQILIQPSCSSSSSSIIQHTGPFDESSGLETTLIDFGLSRVDAPGSGGGETWWTPLDEEIFEGEGAQWDVYRSMRSLITSSSPSHASSDWDAYHPQTNVMWLEFILASLLKTTTSKKKPTAKAGRSKSKSAGVMLREVEAYGAMVETRKVLLLLKGWEEGEGGGAGGLVRWGREKGWCA